MGSYYSSESNDDHFEALPQDPDPFHLIRVESLPTPPSTKMRLVSERRTGNLSIFGQRLDRLSQFPFVLNVLKHILPSGNAIKSSEQCHQVSQITQFAQHDVAASNLDACALRGCICNEGLETAVSSAVLGDRTSDDATRQICCCTCSGNTQVLALASFLFTSITVSQIIGSLVANSNALFTDAMAMVVDTATYFVSMVAENIPLVWIKLVVPFFSMAILVFATMKAMRESVRELTGDGRENGNAVNPYIVLLFSVWCLVLDVVVIAQFVRNAKGRRHFGAINMLAAFAHVAADFCRSGATCVESFLILYFHVDGQKADAWATVVVSMIIFLGVVYPAFEWSKALHSYWRDGILP